MEKQENPEHPDSTSSYQAFETCVLCGKKTHIPIDTPIAARQGYVEGSGQLCPACYKKIKNV
ncbi:hypothetical protein [Eubacterium maltosivorans]|uniref:hypothetical protein n=1 Tax=Eubacterium maltosivorans TaxID=2041044 RepID=UPI00189D7607|nr:hypothetical protein [Eubacterium maltosivorans]